MDRRRFAPRRIGKGASDGVFLGYVGIQPLPPNHPLGGGVEIGWRLARAAWGYGYASEAARASLRHGYETLAFCEVLSFTAPDNLRSQAVMGQIGLRRDPARDFVSAEGWEGWVWVGAPGEAARKIVFATNAVLRPAESQRN